MKKSLILIIIALSLSFAVYPMQYVLNIKVNFLPIQFIIYTFILIFLFQYNFNPKFFKYIGYFIIYFTLISLYNIVNPVSLVTNAILLSMFTFMILLVSTKIKDIKIKYLDQILLYFFIIFIIYSFYLNLEHISEVGWIIRSKGFGSGTLYATLSIITFIYFTYKIKLNEMHWMMYIAISIVPLWSLLLTQSRGALLVLIFALIFMNLKKIRSIIYLFAVLIVIFWLAIFFIPEVSSLAFIKRLNPNTYHNLAELTSNRVQTQEMILQWLDKEQSILSLLFGNGLNSLKYIVNHSTYEYPHFDLLYILYDGGIYSLIFYFIFLYLLIRKNNSKIYMLMYFLSGFHTNMILSPAFILLAFLLDTNQDLKLHHTRTLD